MLDEIEDLVKKLCDKEMETYTYTGATDTPRQYTVKSFRFDELAAFARKCVDAGHEKGFDDAFRESLDAR